MASSLISIDTVDEIKITTLIENQAGFGTSLLAQHGLSFLLDILSGNTQKRILFDTGASAKPILHNMNMLGMNPKSIDMIYLSHCHYDHTTGLAEILQAIDKEVPIVSHSSLFRGHYTIKPYLKNIGVSYENRKEQIHKYKGKFIFVNTPFALMKGVISTGEIERVTEFEEQNVSSVYTTHQGELVLDKMLDDQSLVIHLKDKGLLIISGCSHAGIINIIKHSIKITGIHKIYGIIGGLHLAKADDPFIRLTADALLKIQPQLLAIGHCTGFKALCHLNKIFGDQLEPLYAGKQLHFK
ncbi:MBL fold metallo-hydrolase [Clostridiaceae bacterium 35-E11]